MDTTKRAAFERGDLVKFWGTNAAAEDGVETYRGEVTSGAQRMMRIDGCGDLVPHVRVISLDGDGDAHWMPVARLSIVA